MIQKILIANRGEIAVRIIRACRELSIPTVAVYSAVDRTALHVQYADEAVFIGPPEPLESYLNMDAVIAAAKRTGADAIHPGYGFLAENHLFARRCEQEGFTFIGPGSETLRLVGDKLEARETMLRAGIPIIPGMMGRSEIKIEEFVREAETIGYPVLIKASAGGGGKGMRIVHSRQELMTSIEGARREARSAFGDDTIYLEKYLQQPRHIEFQILGDKFGNVIHLFERECSIQRRHQKIIEETPSTAIDDDLRTRMGEVAIQVAKASGYYNAGTVEFLLDRENNFYFLEVNARIQVEHPITEMVTGVDLVKQQIRVASGERLILRQEDVHQRGHAIECRIYAEDPENNFLPSPGKILFMKEPTGPGIRNDCGIYTGFEVSPYYDPILAKLIAWGENREVARQRMIAALSDYPILGIKTPIEFLKDVMVHPEFAAGRTFTNFIEQHLAHWKETRKGKKFATAALIAAAMDAYRNASDKRPVSVPRQIATNPWLTCGKWQIASTT